MSGYGHAVGLVHPDYDPQGAAVDPEIEHHEGTLELTGEGNTPEHDDNEEGNH